MSPTGLSQTLECSGWIKLGLLAVLVSGTTLRAQNPDGSGTAKSVSFSASYTSEVLGNLSGGEKQGAVYEGLLTLGCAIDLKPQGSSFSLTLLDTHGPSLSNNYLHDLNGVSNIDAYDTLRLSELWFQQQSRDGKISFRIGQLLADSEFFVSGNANLFLNGAFGAPSIIGLNLRAPVYPVAAPGARLRWDYTEKLGFQAGVFSGDAGEENTNNKHGTTWRLGHDAGVLAVSEVLYRPKAATQSLQGTYKLGAFFHSTSSAYPEPGNGRRADGGAYVIADQELWRKGDSKSLSGFFRAGAAPGDRNLARFFFDTGIDFKGLLAGRNSDTAGLGFTYTNLSDRAGIPIQTRHEAILEATYCAQITNWFCVQPDCQYIFNPGGVQAAANALVVGLRATLSF